MAQVVDLDTLIQEVEKRVEDVDDSVRGVLEVAGEILFTLPDDVQKRVLSLWVTSVQGRCVQSVNAAKQKLDEEHRSNHERLTKIAQKFAS